MTLPIDPRDDQARIPQQHPAPLPAEPAPAPHRPRRRWPWIAAAAIIVVPAVAGGTVYALMPSGEDEAVDRCQTAITDKLRSPSTAKYGDIKVTSHEGDFGTTYYEMGGTLDAQNGFGAMVRSAYRCKVQQESDGTWLVTESTLAQG